MAGTEPEGKAVGQRGGERASAGVGGDKLLNEGESAKKAGSEDGYDGTDDPEWDEKEK